jgi:tRNA(His) guanylyltransferase
LRSRKEEILALGHEMKVFEAATCDATADLSNICVIRLDGHCFRTFTKGFARPYDLRIHRAMISTAADCLERFGAATAYTESDEISLLFAPASSKASPSLPFNGRVQKLCSVTAGFASARFNRHMLMEKYSATEAMLQERVDRSEAHFDSRVFSLPSIEKVCAGAM